MIESRTSMEERNISLKNSFETNTHTHVGRTEPTRACTRTHTHTHTQADTPTPTPTHERTLAYKHYTEDGERGEVCILHIGLCQSVDMTHVSFSSLPFSLSVLSLKACFQILY